MKYHEYRERYNVRHNGSQIGNHHWASDWHHDHWPCDRYDVVANRSRIGNHPLATIDNMTFDFGWPYRLRSRLQDFLIKCLEYEDRYNVGLKSGQIGNYQWAFDWPYVLWPWMTLNRPTSRSSKLHVKYCKNGDLYKDCVNGSQIGNHPCTIDWQHELWPWMTLNHPRSRSGFLQQISQIWWQIQCWT